MVFLTTANPRQNERIFYGLKKNGRPLFINKINNENNYFYSMEVNQTNDDKKFESESIVIKLSKSNESSEINQKEYLMSISKKNSYVEIYDFDKNIIYQKHIKSFTNTNNLVVSFRHSLIPIFSNNSTDFYYLFGFVNNGNNYILQKHKFQSLENFQNDITLNKSY